MSVASVKQRFARSGPQLVLSLLSFLAPIAALSCSASQAQLANGEFSTAIQSFEQADKFAAFFEIKIETIEATQVGVPYQIEMVVDGDVNESSDVLLGIEGLPRDPTEGYVNTEGFLEIDGDRVSKAKGSKNVLVGHRGFIVLEGRGDTVRRMFSDIERQVSLASQRATGLIRELRDKRSDRAAAGENASTTELNLVISELESRLEVAESQVLHWQRWLVGSGDGEPEFDEFVRKYVTIRVLVDSGSSTDDEGSEQRATRRGRGHIPRRVSSAEEACYCDTV